MKYIQRHLEADLKSYIAGAKLPHNVILLYGARQVGKSTLLFKLFPSTTHVHINFAKEAGFASLVQKTTSFEDFTLLLNAKYKFEPGARKNRFLIIDEAQLAPKLGSYVRFMKEEWKNQRVILTGSTLVKLFDTSEKPTGRITEFTLRPFSFQEFLVGIGKSKVAEKIKEWTEEKPFSDLIHQEILKDVQNYLMVGGLPDVVSAFNNNKDYLKPLADIFGFYQRDFNHAMDERWQHLYQQIMLRISTSLGSNISLSAIVKSSETGYKKVPELLSLIESWHQILKVDVEVSKLQKVGAITPKRYIFDLGIRYLQNAVRFHDLDLLDSEAVKRSEYGGLIENFVATELFSLGGVIAPRAWSLTNQSGHIDFMLLNNKKTFGVEVKAATKIDGKHFSSLYSWSEYFPKSELVLTNLSSGGFRKVNGKKIVIVPLYALRNFINKR